jgi:hypothetical protein
MKNLAYLIIPMIFLLACNNERDEHGAADTSADTEGISKSKILPYSVELDGNTQNLVLVESDGAAENLSKEDVVQLLNKKYPGIQLEQASVTGDTIRLTIRDASQLTQTMGSAGAQAYLAEVVFSLTEVEGLKKVKLDFQEGDHAMPGIYQRSDFADLLPKE